MGSSVSVAMSALLDVPVRKVACPERSTAGARHVHVEETSNISAKVRALQELLSLAYNSAYEESAPRSIIFYNSNCRGLIDIMIDESFRDFSEYIIVTSDLVHPASELQLIVHFDIPQHSTYILME